jgi:hypothetical protein
VRGVLGGGVQVGGVVGYEQSCQVKKSKKASLDQEEFKKDKFLNKSKAKFSFKWPIHFISGKQFQKG